MMPWELFPELWKTEAAYAAWLRGCVRRGFWEKHPVKLMFLKANLVKVVNTNPRSMKRFPMVNRGKCALCGGIFAQGELEVDHKVGNHSLKTLADLQAFIEAIIHVTMDDLQLVCKPCHKIKSHAEKKGFTFDEARCDKEALAISKTSKDVQWLKQRGVVPATTKPKRRQQIFEELLKGV